MGGACTDTDYLVYLLVYVRTRLDPWRKKERKREIISILNAACPYSIYVRFRYALVAVCVCVCVCVCVFELKRGV